MMHPVLIAALLLMVLGTTIVESEPCSIPYVSNGFFSKEAREEGYGRYRAARKINVGKRVNDNEELYLHCSVRFEGVGSGNRTTKIFCREGKWSSEPLCKPASCKAEVPFAAGAEAVDIHREHGGAVSYRCSPDHRKLTDETVICDYGVWRGEPPTCKSTSCHGEPPFAPNGSPVVRSQVHGTIIWYRCHKGYLKISAGNVTCHLGSWIGIPPKCVNDGEGHIPSTASPISENFTAAVQSSSSSSSAVHSTTAIPRERDEKKHSAEECFCKYPLEENEDILAFADGKRLTFGDRVRIGTNVVFHCLHVGYHRFRGHREITCSNCDAWNSSFPSCTAPTRGDAVIVLSKDAKVLKDGNIEIHKGQSINFTCVVPETDAYPQWNAPKVSGISFVRERRERKDKGDVLYLSHLQMQNADYENEGIYECSAGSNHETMIRIVITDPRVRCPEFPGSEDITVTYEMERREKSKAWFSCPKEEQALFGKSVLTCLRSGEWSDPSPHCSGSCQVPSIIGGSVKEEKLGDWYWQWFRYTRDVTHEEIPPGKIVPSGTVLWFYCGEADGRQKEEIRCFKGRWSKDLRCRQGPQCSIRDLLASIPGYVALDMTGVNNESISSGSEVNLQCRGNSIIHGNSKALCGHHGKWVFGNFQCDTGCRLNIDPSSHLLVQPIKDGYFIGDTVLLSCPAGEEMTIPIERLMCLGNTWSDTLPDCRKSERIDRR